MPSYDDTPEAESVTDLAAGLLQNAPAVDDDGGSGDETPDVDLHLLPDQEDDGHDHGAEDPDNSDDEDQDNDEGAEQLFTVKIGGKEMRVTQAELVAGYQREKDYTRKTEEVASQRKLADTELETARSRRFDYEQKLMEISNLLDAVPTRSAAEWDKLRAEDPQRY